MTENKQVGIENKNVVANFEFDEAYRDINANGELFRIDLSDEKRADMAFDFKDAYEKLKDAPRPSVENMTREEFKKAQDYVRDTTKVAIDSHFGENSFDRLYKIAGRSYNNCIQFLGVCLEQIADYDEKINKRMQRNKASQYLKNKKK